MTDGGPETELASVEFAAGLLEREMLVDVDLDLDVGLDSGLDSFEEASSSITPTTSPSGATTS